MTSFGPSKTALMNYLQLLKRHPNYIGYGALHFFFSSPGQTFFISLFVVYFIEALSIDHLSFDWLYSGATLLSAFVLPYVGKFVDVVRLRNFSISAGLAFAFFCVLVFLSQNIYTLFLAIFGLRLCGQALLPLTANTSVGRFFDSTRGKALSLINFGVSIGESILPPLAVLLIATVGWQYTWLTTALLVLLVFIPSAMFMVPYDSPFQFAPKEQSAEKSKIKLESSLKSKTRAEAIREGRFYLLILISLFMPFFSTGIMINSSLVSASYGWSPELMAICLSAFGIARLLMNFLAGSLIDRFSGIWVFSLQLLPMLLGCLLMMFYPSPGAWIVFFVLMGVSSSLISLSGTATWAEVYGPQHLGSIRSLASTFGVFSTALAPIILGLGLADLNSQFLTFSISAIVMVLLTLLGIGLARKQIGN